MRVLILTTQYLPHIGGSELAIKHLTERLPQVDFVIVSSGFGGKWLLPLSGFFRSLRRRFDVIHVFQASYAGGAGVLLKLFFPTIPLIVSLQEGKELEKQSFFVKFFRKTILRKADVITAISNYLLEYARRANPNVQHILLPNGVEPEKFDIQGEKQYTLVSSSRLVYKNGIDTLIQALALLPNASLLLVGDGPDRKKLERLARQLDVVNRIVFAGAITYDELPQYLAQANIFVRPSRSEGLGIAFLDAMAAGVPVIGTPVGGIPDFLKDHETGLFCKPDNPQSIARAVEMLLNNATLYTTIQSNALHLVRTKYSWDTIAVQYGALLTSLCNAS